MSASSILTALELGRRIPEIMLSMLVLPLPDGPTTYSILPKLAPKLTSCTV
jgi:hypothetical protein